MTGQEFYVGVTDPDWFEFLRSRRPLDEVNFWSPGTRLIQAPLGSPFLFKRRAPRNTIGGGGFIQYAERMKIREAWEFYGEKNGVASLAQLIQRVSKYRKSPAVPDDEIACLVLAAPLFLGDGVDIELPEDWSANVQVTKKYDRSDPIGLRLWNDFMMRAPMQPVASPLKPFGGVAEPALYIPRRGQGTFRRLVLNAYGNRCAITGERTVPVLQASHIRDFADVREHEIANGIALRADIHTLFDRGYVTVSPDSRFLVSDALREDFSNGRIYYDLHGKEVRLPVDPAQRPARESLDWHRAERFKG